MLAHLLPQQRLQEQSSICPLQLLTGAAALLVAAAAGTGVHLQPRRHEQGGELQLRDGATAAAAAAVDCSRIWGRFSCHPQQHQVRACPLKLVGLEAPQQRVCATTQDFSTGTTIDADDVAGTPLVPTFTSLQHKCTFQIARGWGRF